ncbi:PAS domain-containing sensor histidine kinase [Pontibacter sp. SGAir0037]|nr:PAS domain-containing sensor histidine kinase [Pontibacter sp. SGAir0037]
MGALMRAYDWDTHPLGNPETWPQSLKNNVRLLLNSGFPMFIWWSRELYSFHNDPYLPALGDKHPMALGTSAPVVWAEIWGQLQGIVTDILNGGEPFYAEALKLMLERKGFLEETYWTFSYSPAFDDDGSVKGIFCACSEVTSTILGQRRLKSLKDISDAMSQLQTQQSACQSVCDILNQNTSDIPFSMIFLLNGAGSVAQLAGHSGGNLSTTDLLRIDLTEEGNEFARHLNAVLASGRAEIIDLKSLSVEAMIHIRHVNGARQAAIIPIFRPGHNYLIGFFISGLSSTLEYNQDFQNFHQLLAGQIATSIAGVQAREEMARQQKYLSEIFQQAPVGITILNGPDYIVELANPGICELWGRTLEEVLNKPLLSVLPEVRDQGIKELLDGVLTTGIPYVNNELPVTLERNGKMEKVHFNFVYQPLRNAQGFITGIIAVAVGVDEQVQARHEIEAMNKELLATNADLDNFVYSASHDLKAPISNIEGLMHALVHHLPEETLHSDTVMRLIELIRGSIDRFKRAVADLTEVAKIQRESEEDVTNIQLPEVVKEVLLDFETLIHETQARIETDFAEASTISFSAKNIRSIVYNLVSNALKYRSPDRTPHIHIATEVTADQLVLTVSDNGLGVNMADKQKMFSMFKRLHDHVEGSGVGLYIVKRIVENAGGRIEVDGTVGVGTTFKVYFILK